jgi:hypothetical protein
MWRAVQNSANSRALREAGELLKPCKYTTRDRIAAAALDAVCSLDSLMTGRAVELRRD